VTWSARQRKSYWEYLFYHKKIGSQQILWNFKKGKRITEKREELYGIVLCSVLIQMVRKNKIKETLQEIYIQKLKLPCCNFNLFSQGIRT
jgi:hypothetical protein